MDVLFGLGMRDTQCGSKVFKRRAIKEIIDDMKITGFAFDVEMLYRLTKKGYKIREVPIKWVNNEDSKVSFLDVIDMSISLFKLRFLG